ncbi:uncharacterized protein LOC122258024 [Penaeus japonicus]|uniref:uncharacterized protein LOC122258024 n=1 Tax=Penaeus japonicus TaxID=27405 RepID=UPI001C7109D1|nr:uncharacterized protein LOC122258024 [Penaeus japonicus]
MAGILHIRSEEEMPSSVTIKIEAPSTIDTSAVKAEVVCATASENEYFDYMINSTCGYVDSVEKANETVKRYQERTSSKFICYKVQRSFGRNEWCLDNHKILWHQEEQKVKLENNFLGSDGIPYVLIGSKILECQFGIDRNLYQKKRHQERRKVELLKIKDRRHPISKKVNCPAKIILKDVIKFPSFKAEKNTAHAKKLKALLLRLALKESRAEGERRIYIQLPEETDHCNHEKGADNKRPRKPREIQNTKVEILPTLDVELNETDFLHTFRVTRPVYQFLVDEWQKEAKENLMEDEVQVENFELYSQHVLAVLYYLGSTESLASVCSRFKIKSAAFIDITVKFADFLLKQSDKYLSLPSLEERIRIAEVIKHNCGFPGAFGAMDAALIHMKTPSGADKQEYTYVKEGTSCKCAFVLQFVVDHRLLFRDIHLDSPATGTRVQVFQESQAWTHLQSLSSAETHIVAPATYPLAPAIMTPHVKDVLSYQEALFNENHHEASKLTTNAMTVFKSRFKRMQQMERHVATNMKLLKATCILHNIALMHENEMVLENMQMEYNSEMDDEGWHNVGMEEFVAEFGILGGEEKRHYLTTVMTARPDTMLSYVQLSPSHIGDNLVIT